MISTKKTKVDIPSWKRVAHFKFFQKFEQPFFGISTEINCTSAFEYCKKYNVPFLLYYLHKSLSVANQIKEFKYRIENDEVFEHTSISGSITVLRRDETFGFAYFDFDSDFKSFALHTKQAIDMEKTGHGLQIKPNFQGLIHYSILPEICFSGMQHAQLLSGQDSVPKIVFGKIAFKDNIVSLPIAIHVHHALCDGIHVSQFIRQFQAKMEVFG